MTFSTVQKHTDVTPLGDFLYCLSYLVVQCHIKCVLQNGRMQHAELIKHAKKSVMTCGMFARRAGKSCREKRDCGHRTGVSRRCLGRCLGRCPVRCPVPLSCARAPRFPAACLVAAVGGGDASPKLSMWFLFAGVLPTPRIPIFSAAGRNAFRPTLWPVLHP